MKFTWINKIICKDLYAPFILEKDIDYYDNLSKKYKILLEKAIKAGAILQVLLEQLIMLLML